MGPLQAWLVGPANEQDRAQVAALAEQVPEVTGEMLAVAFVAQGYRGEHIADAAAAHGIRLEVVTLPTAKHGFVLLPRIHSALGCLTPAGFEVARRQAQPESDGVY